MRFAAAGGREGPRVYAVPKRTGQVPTLRVVLRRPEAYEFVGLLQASASYREVLRADDCLDGRVRDEPFVEPATSEGRRPGAAQTPG
jgi:hypothetical protein